MHVAQALPAGAGPGLLPPQQLLPFDLALQAQALMAAQAQAHFMQPGMLMQPGVGMPGFAGTFMPQAGHADAMAHQSQGAGGRRQAYGFALQQQQAQMLAMQVGSPAVPSVYDRMPRLSCDSALGRRV